MEQIGQTARPSEEKFLREAGSTPQHNAYGQLNNLNTSDPSGDPSCHADAHANGFMDASFVSIRGDKKWHFAPVH